MNVPSNQLLSGLDIRLARREIARILRAAGNEFAAEESDEFLMATAGLSRAELLSSDWVIDAKAARCLEDYIARRMGGEPVDHILGWREFYGRRFSISKNVLSPRADTEALISHALTHIGNMKAPRILDLGTGSGAILITLLLEHPGAVGTGTDLSEAGLSAAKDNALKHDVQAAWHQGSWFDALPEPAAFDLILSNPPYITDEAMTRLEPEVKNYDPSIALSGGADGLDAYRNIIASARDWLAPHGWLGVEIGFDQGEAVKTLFEDSGLDDVSLHQDLGGHDRIIFGKKSPQ